MVDEEKRSNINWIVWDSIFKKNVVLELVPNELKIHWNTYFGTPSLSKWWLFRWQKNTVHFRFTSFSTLLPHRKNFSVQRNPILYLGLDLHFRGRGLKIGNKEASRTYTIGFRYLVPVMAERQKDFIFPPILTWRPRWCM